MDRIIRHVTAFIAPVILILVFPFFIILFEHNLYSHPVITVFPLFFVVGGFLTVIGLFFWILSVRLIIKIGNGTIMPWDPTKKLVIAGLYMYVRNPMILSIIIIQIGEAFIFGSIGIGIMVIINFLTNTIFFIYSEEPGLIKRFGKEYVEYKKNVPRWIPRLKPWKPNSQ